MDTESTNQATNENTEKITFDEKQQQKVNELIQQAMGRAGSEAKKEATKLQEQLTALKDELESAKKNLETKPNTTKVEGEDRVAALEARINEMTNAHRNLQSEVENKNKALQAKETEVKRANENALNIRKEILLTQAAGKINPYEVEEVVRATSSSVSWDETAGKFIVVDPFTQQPRLNSSFEPMTIDEFYLEFASKKPYMIKSGARPGTGSSETNNNGVYGNGKFSHKQIFGKESNSRLANKLALEDPKEYARLKQMARQDGTITY